MADLQRLTELAELVADGRTADWASACNDIDELDSDTVEQLRAVASISRFFATLSGGASAHRRPHVNLPSGSTWGTLRVLEHVGCGRFGDVYRAWDPALDRDVALKILRPIDDDDAAETQVVEEGRLMARVRHPNVVSIYGAQRIGGATGLWMEFIKGRTLAAELAERGTCGAEEIARVGVELCRALEAVHGAGLVHRDVKAQNVLRDEGGRIVLGDFGTGREVAEFSSSSGSLAGTPTHLAPELFEGHPVSAQSDLYGLGVLLFHLATREYPVAGRSLRDLRDAHTRGTRTSLASLRPDLPKRLAQVIETALDANPAHRFKSAQAMGHALEPVSRKHRPASALVAAVTVVTLAAAAFAMTWTIRRDAHVSIPFAERDWVLVTAFENRTGEPSLDGALEYALERELANSSFVNVVPRARIADTLQMMRKPLETRIDESLGLELAQRDGAIRAAIVGRVERIGGAYTMSARILNPANGSAAGIVSEASIAPADLLPAVERVAIEIRRQLGERLPQLAPAGVRLEKVATPSIRALQLYSQARALTGELILFAGTTAPRAAEQLLRDALLEDADFVWAGILMAHALRAQGGRNAEAIQHLERAAAAAAADPGVDRYIAVAELDAFRGRFTSDAAERTRYFEQALGKFEAALQVQPDHFWAMTCLMNISRSLGRPLGRPLIDRYVAMRPNNVGVFGHAMDAAFAAGDLALAREYARRGSALDVKADVWAGFDGNTAANLRMFAAREALLQRNARLALLEADRLAADPRSRLPGVVNRTAEKLFYLYRTLGRLDRVEDVAMWTQPESSGRRLLAIAGLEREDRTALRPLLRKLFPTPGKVLGGSGGLSSAVSRAFIEAGMFDGTEGLLDELRSRNVGRGTILVEGQLAVAQGRITHGVRLLEQLVQDAKDADGQFPIRRDAALSLADVWMSRGDHSRAVTTLEGIVSQPLANPFEGLVPEYVRVRERLAQAYRHVGRITEADEIESDLRLLLAVATDDHPMKRRLTRTGS